MNAPTPPPLAENAATADAGPERLRFHRLLLVVGGAIILGMGVIQRFANPAAREPFWFLRVLAAASCLVPVGLSYFSERVRGYFTLFNHVSCYVVTAWIITAAALNGMTMVYAVGVVYTVLCVGVFLGVSTDRVDLAVRYLVFALGSVAAAFFLLPAWVALPAPQLSPLLLLGFLSGSAVVIYYTVAWHARTQRRLAERTREMRDQKERAEEANAELAQTSLEMETLSMVARETDNAVLLADADGRIEWVNDAFTRLTGYELDELHERFDNRMQNAVPVEQIDDLMETAAREEGAVSYEWSFEALCGETKHLSSTLTPVFGEGGELQHFVVVDTDLTEHVRAEREMSEQKELLRAIIDHIPEAIWVKDPESRFIVANEHVAGQMGVDDPDELLGKSDFDFYEQARAEEAYRDEQHIIETGEAQIAKEEQGTHLVTGETQHTLSSKVPVYGSEGEILYIAGTSFDITERKRLENRQKTQQRLLRAIIDHIPEAIWVKDPESRFLVANEYVADLMGADDPDELVGKTDFDFFEREMAERFYQDERHIVETGEAQIAKEETRKHVKTGERQHTLSTKVPIFDADGNVVQIAGMSIDITERKELEEQLMEARDRAQEAARAKSAFLANMSHEIRTPLNGVIGMTSLLDDTDLSGEQQEFVDVVRTSGEALLSIINDILDFSKIEAGKITLDSQPFAVHEVVEEALDLVRPKAAEKEIDLAYCVGASAPAALHGDVTRVRQILTNLLSNAVKFAEEGTVNVRVEAAPAGGGENGGENDDGRAVRFAVEDTGIGIPEEQQSELFDSFNQADASTTREYGGTGLGLAISKRLAELMGGTMDVESAAGEGSTFHFTIRAEAADLPEPRQQQLFEAQTALDGRRVLVVDDNETNRRMMQLQAERWGMEPVLVASGAEALRRVRAEQAGRFDVAVLDMHMPEMDGLELARTLADERPGMARLMLSSSGHRRQDEPALNAWLSKPARVERLLRTLRTLVGDGDPDDEAPAPERRQLERDLGERHPLRILLAEDNPVNQKVALRVLGRLGYRADAVADGREVLGAVKRQRYDVVLMDVQMPEMDGKEAARRLCERYPDDDERPRLVAVTANATEDGRTACYRAGMDDYLAKPFEARTLADTLRQCTRLPEEPPPPAEDDDGEAAPPASSSAGGAAAADGEDLPVFDPAYLHEQVGDDPAFVEELIGHFLEDAPQQIEAMRAACQRANADALEHAAHTLKANARTFGAERLARLCQTLEERGNEGRTDAPTTALVDEAERAFARVREAVEAHRVSAR